MAPYYLLSESLLRRNLQSALLQQSAERRRRNAALVTEGRADKGKIRVCGAEMHDRLAVGSARRQIADVVNQLVLKSEHEVKRAVAEVKVNQKDPFAEP